MAVSFCAPTSQFLVLYVFLFAFKKHNHAGLVMRRRLKPDRATSHASDQCPTTYPTNKRFECVRT